LKKPQLKPLTEEQKEKQVQAQRLAQRKKILEEEGALPTQTFASSYRQAIYRELMIIGGAIMGLYTALITMIIFELPIMIIGFTMGTGVIAVLLIYNALRERYRSQLSGYLILLMTWYRTDWTNFTDFYMVDRVEQISVEKLLVASARMNKTNNTVIDSLLGIYCPQCLTKLIKPTKKVKGTDDYTGQFKVHCNVCNEDVDLQDLKQLQCKWICDVVLREPLDKFKDIDGRNHFVIYSDVPFLDLINTGRMPVFMRPLTVYGQGGYMSIVEKDRGAGNVMIGVPLECAENVRKLQQREEISILQNPILLKNLKEIKDKYYSVELERTVIAQRYQVNSLEASLESARTGAVKLADNLIHDKIQFSEHPDVREDVEQKPKTVIPAIIFWVAIAVVGASIMSWILPRIFG